MLFPPEAPTGNQGRTGGREQGDKGVAGSTICCHTWVQTHLSYKAFPINTLRPDLDVEG